MSERSYLVVSAVGEDRPGLVAELTAAIAARGGNVEDSRMAVLGGAFGVMILVSGPAIKITGLTAEAEAIERSTGLRLHLTPTNAPRDGGATRRYTINVEAADREGILHAIAATLFDLGGNIVSAESAIYPAPVSGAPLFRLDIAVDLPREVSRELLDARLDELAVTENLDCEVVTKG